MDARSRALTREEKDEFRAGFYPARLSAWIEDLADDDRDVEADVAGSLVALEHGQRDFAYPGHDGAVLKLLREIVPRRALVSGADVGCETGVFPAMQLDAGIESCTVFEVRETSANHPRVTVRVKDLTYADHVEPEFDLITCLSTIEHIGLGRYGDPIDPWGDVKWNGSLAQRFPSHSAHISAPYY